LAVPARTAPAFGILPVAANDFGIIQRTDHRVRPILSRAGTETRPWEPLLTRAIHSQQNPSAAAGDNDLITSGFGYRPSYSLLETTAPGSLSASGIHLRPPGSEAASIGTQQASDSISAGMIRRSGLPVNVVHRQGTSSSVAKPLSSDPPVVSRAGEVINLQRATATSAQTSGPGPPLGTNTNRLPERYAASSNLPPGIDVNLLANRVYDLLARRLASERQRRGA
jgi:hypothetical protein